MSGGTQGSGSSGLNPAQMQQIGVQLLQSGLNSNNMGAARGAAPRPMSGAPQQVPGLIQGQQGVQPAGMSTQGMNQTLAKQLGLLGVGGG